MTDRNHNECSRHSKPSQEQKGTAPQHVCSATGPRVTADPRLCAPPCYSTYPIGREANACTAMNLPLNAGRRPRTLAHTMLIMAFLDQHPMARVLRLVDTSGRWEENERGSNRISQIFFVFWIVRGLPLTLIRWLYLVVAEKRATPAFLHEG
jgi:hypothetical protein